MTPLQQKELELLTLFIQICSQLELRYYLVCGTALGAVKYGGFIPWDDDVDVSMPREDYEVFLQKAPALLPEHVFLQNYRTDPAFPQIFSKLRNSNTTYIEKSAGKLPINHGIYIDIFPLDGYPENPQKQKQLEWKKRMYLHLLGAAFAPPAAFKSRVLYRIKRLLGFHRRTVQIAEAYDQMIRQFPLHSSELWCNHGNWQGKQEYAPKAQYGEGAEAMFEGVPVQVPQLFEAYLRQKYGDFTKDPPVEEQIGHHYYEIFDTERSYLEYLNIESRVKE